MRQFRFPDDPDFDSEAMLVMMNVRGAASNAARSCAGLEPADLLHWARRNAGKTQAQTAFEAGLSPFRLNRIERGKVDPRWSEIGAVLRTLGQFPMLYCLGKIEFERARQNSLPERKRRPGDWPD